MGAVNSDDFINQPDFKLYKKILLISIVLRRQKS